MSDIERLIEDVKKDLATRLKKKAEAEGFEIFAKSVKIVDDGVVVTSRNARTVEFGIFAWNRDMSDEEKAEARKAGFRGKRFARKVLEEMTNVGNK